MPAGFHRQAEQSIRLELKKYPSKDALFCIRIIFYSLRLFNEGGIRPIKV